MKRLALLVLLISISCLGCAVEAPDRNKQPSNVTTSSSSDKDDKKDDGLDIGISPATGNPTVENFDIGTGDYTPFDF